MKKVILIAFLALGAFGCKKDKAVEPIQVRNVSVIYDGDPCPSFVVSLSSGDTLLNTSLSGDTSFTYALESKGEMFIHIDSSVPVHTTTIELNNPLQTYVTNGNEIIVYL